MTTMTQIEYRDPNNATVTLSSDEKYTLNRNENGWCVCGTEHGWQWQRDDFDSIEEAIDDLVDYVNES